MSLTVRLHGCLTMLQHGHDLVVGVIHDVPLGELFVDDLLSLEGSLLTGSLAVVVEDQRYLLDGEILGFWEQEIDESQPPKVQGNVDAVAGLGAGQPTVQNGMGPALLAPLKGC